MVRRTVFVMACTAMLPAVSPGQYTPQYTPPPPPLTPAPCVPTRKDPCTVPPGDQPLPAPPASKYPFPGDAPSAPAPAAGGAAGKFPYPGEAPGDASPAPQPASGAGGDAASKYPYPGEAPSPAGGASSSSSSSSGSGQPGEDSSAADGSPAPVARSQRRPLPKAVNLGEREAEDLEVSHFYLQSGDYLGAYSRAKDAVKSMPDDPEAHYALALAAAKMKKNDEAAAEFNAYLKAEPDGDHVRAAKAALQQMAGR